MAGVPVRMEPEYAAEAARKDHVKLTFTVGKHNEMQAALNTLSRRNRDAGFDERIRVGTVRSTWEDLPEAGIFDGGRLDYGEIERQANVFYEYYKQQEMEAMLIEKARRAVMAEIWGDIYAHNHAGVHQIHSRRTSCAVAEDIVGRDGALKLYYAEGRECELLLFKFCGQP